MIQLSNLSLKQGSFQLKSVSLEIPNLAYGILMGATGCGKSTLLEAICGLRRIQSGTVHLDGHNVTNWSPADRQIGYVPQDLGLFPTMRVDHQIEFAMKLRKVSRAERKDRVEELVDRLELRSIMHRYTFGLSGGERQRVAIARALSFRPRLLCLDEPLSALDGPTWQRLANHLRNIHQHEQITVLHVTHNLNEAHQLGTILFQMRDGQVSRVARPTLPESQNS